MSDDNVVIPLRVSREQRRKWRVEAGKWDWSVQRWILKQLGIENEPLGVGEPKTTKVKSKPVEPTEMVADIPELNKDAYRPSNPVVQPVSEFLCKICGKPTNGEYLCKNCKK